MALGQAGEEIDPAGNAPRAILALRALSATGLSDELLAAADGPPSRFRLREGVSSLTARPRWRRRLLSVQHSLRSVRPYR